MNKLRSIVFAAITLVVIGLLGLPYLAVADDDDDTIQSVVTLWWIVFNNPEKCIEDDGDPTPRETLCNAPDFDRKEVEAAVLYGTGQVTQRNGRVKLAAALYKTADEANGSFDPPDEIDPFKLNAGLKDPMGAEVHLIVRSHGPVLPSEFEAQLNSFNGGCKKQIEAPNIPNKPGECADIHFAVHPPNEEESFSHVYTFGRVERVPRAKSKLLRTKDSIRFILNTTVEAKISD